jgi:hypothetical protein
VNKNFRTVLLYLVLLAVLVWVVMLQMNKTGTAQPKALTTSEHVHSARETNRMVFHFIATTPYFG